MPTKLSFAHTAIFREPGNLKARPRCQLVPVINRIQTARHKWFVRANRLLAIRRFLPNLSNNLLGTFTEHEIQNRTLDFRHWTLGRSSSRPQLPIQRPILNRLRHMLARDSVRIRQVRNRSRHFQNPVIRPRAQVQIRHRELQQFLCWFA